ncbi:MAG: hypothetical protein DWI10_04945 [Planctomycetota bacterium]|nr:MAG: hypothetical protein DWI10_04945 [Planctomycetota bacterium]
MALLIESATMSQQDEYNTHRPHSSLGYLPLAVFASVRWCVGI